jgi:tetratricopeptide (TPR) repeat protein
LLAQADGTVPPLVRAKAEVAAGRLSWCQDRDGDALRHYQAALIVYEALEMPERVGIVEGLMGFAERSNGDNTAARARFERARGIADRHDSERLRILVVNGLASIAADEGDLASARRGKESSLQSARAVGDQFLVALMAASLGKVCYQTGDYQAARMYVRESLAISRELGNKWVVPYAIELLADICAHEKDTQKSVRLYGAASAQREALAMSFSVTDRLPHEQALDRLRQQLPHEAFDREWQSGRALDLRASVELALQDGHMKQS